MAFKKVFKDLDDAIVFNLGTCWMKFPDGWSQKKPEASSRTKRRGSAQMEIIDDMLPDMQPTETQLQQIDADLAQNDGITPSFRLVDKAKALPDGAPAEADSGDVPDGKITEVAQDAADGPSTEVAGEPPAKEIYPLANLWPRVGHARHTHMHPKKVAGAPVKPEPKPRLGLEVLIQSGWPGQVLNMLPEEAWPQKAVKAGAVCPKSWTIHLPSAQISARLDQKSFWLTKVPRAFHGTRFFSWDGPGGVQVAWKKIKDILGTLEKDGQVAPGEVGKALSDEPAARLLLGGRHICAVARS